MEDCSIDLTTLVWVRRSNFGSFCCSQPFICQVWLSSGPPGFFTFCYYAWLWNWLKLRWLIWRQTRMTQNNAGLPCLHKRSRNDPASDSFHAGLSLQIQFLKTQRSVNATPIWRDFVQNSNESSFKWALHGDDCFNLSGMGHSSKHKPHTSWGVCKRNKRKREGGTGMKRGGEKQQGARMKGRVEGMEEWKGRAESRKPKGKLGEKKGRQKEEWRELDDGRRGGDIYTRTCFVLELHISRLGRWRRPQRKPRKSWQRLVRPTELRAR